MNEDMITFMESIGTLKELFTLYLGAPPEVELLETYGAVRLSFSLGTYPGAAEDAERAAASRYDSKPKNISAGEACIKTTLTDYIDALRLKCSLNYYLSSDAIVVNVYFSADD